MENNPWAFSDVTFCETQMKVYTIAYKVTDPTKCGVLFIQLYEDGATTRKATPIQLTKPGEKFSIPNADAYRIDS